MCRTGMGFIMLTATNVPTDPIASITAMLLSEPDITYGEIAARLGLTVFEVIAILDAAVGA